MLVHLRVQDLVLIEKLDIELSAGFNVLTGETGAGKSLVVTAFDLLLGKRAKSNLVRLGKKEAEIEGLFDVTDEKEISARLDDAGLPSYDELLIRRVIPAEGRHRCYINGKIASLGMLMSLSDGLASVMGQHEQHTLGDSAKQLTLLDGFGQHSKQLTQMKESRSDVKDCIKEYNDLLSKEQGRASKLDYIEFQLNEIDEIDPLPDELEMLEEKTNLLQHQTILLETTQICANELYESDGSIYEKLGKLSRSLNEVVKFDESLENDAKQLSEAAVIIEETARSLSAYGHNTETDPQQLEQLEDRLEDLKKLTRKHSASLAGVIALKNELTIERDTLSKYEDSLSKVKNRLDKLKENAKKYAAILSRDRQKAAKKLSKAVTKELRDLSFERASFDASLSPSGLEPTSKGSDNLDFLVELNPGEGAHPLKKVASGGELSRMMLAIRRVLAGVGPVGTYVFDEVDAGIGGEVANAVGRKLNEVAKHHQVICITHLPQIAAAASSHFNVSKKEIKNRTVTNVAKLSEKHRIEEIARMLGGDISSQKLRDAAQELCISAGKDR